MKEWAHASKERMIFKKKRKPIRRGAELQLLSPDMVAGMHKPPEYDKGLGWWKLRRNILGCPVVLWCWMRVMGGRGLERWKTGKSPPRLGLGEGTRGWERGCKINMGLSPGAVRMEAIWIGSSGVEFTSMLRCLKLDG